MTNNSPEPVKIISFNRYYQNRPELLRNGQKVDYRKDVAERVRLIDEQASFSRVYPIVLEPANETEVERIELEDWYGTLEPGSYGLTNRYRFAIGGDWMEIPAITFEIQPK